MYLTRMKLDSSNRDTMKAMVAPNLLHGAIETSFPGEKVRKLWRVDSLNGEDYLLILSDTIPDLSIVYKQFGKEDNGHPWETLSYDKLLNRITENTYWHFRLVANPTKSVPSGEGQRGKVLAHVTEKYQHQWLMERASKCGFLVEEDDFLVIKSRWFRFHKKRGDKHLVSLLSVTYDGKLKVIDSALFIDALTNGIGRGKAYGMGMLTIVKER